MDSDNRNKLIITSSLICNKCKGSLTVQNLGRNLKCSKCNIIYNVSKLTVCPFCGSRNNRIVMPDERAGTNTGKLAGGLLYGPLGFIVGTMIDETKKSIKKDILHPKLLCESCKRTRSVKIYIKPTSVKLPQRKTTDQKDKSFISKSSTKKKKEQTEPKIALIGILVTILGILTIIPISEVLNPNDDPSFKANWFILPGILILPFIWIIPISIFLMIIEERLKKKIPNDTYSKDGFKQMIRKINKKDNLEEIINNFKKEINVSNVLEFVESEWREDQPGFKSSKKKSLIFVALKNKVLYLLKHSVDKAHPLFPNSKLQIAYEDCSFSRGGGNIFYNITFYLGTFFCGERTIACRLLLNKGELFLIGTKEHVHTLRKALNN